MITQIIIHLMPYEIDWFEWQAKQLRIGSCYIEDKVIVDVTLNLNLVDWKNSQIPKQYFIDKFYQIKQLFDWCEVIFEVDGNNVCLGIDDKRRNSIRKYNPNNFVYLDCDIIFKPETLALLINGSKNINNDYYIISPQTPKLWDSTWNILVNKAYSDKPYEFEKIIDPYSILNTDYGEISLIPINMFKFGGGWFNLISSKLLKLTDIPDSFGPYGEDDTYIMYCCNMMKQKRINVQQYIINNLVIAENNRFRNNPYSQYLQIINKKDEYRAEAKNNLNKELNIFNNKI